MRIDRLGDLGSADAVLSALHHRSARSGLAPPAALTGNWFDSRAVLAPSVRAVAHPPASAFDVAMAGPAAPATPTAPRPVVGGGWIGYLGYPDRSVASGAAEPRLPSAAGGWTDCVLRQDQAGCWWYESLTGVPCPAELRAAVEPDPPTGDARETTARDGTAHREPAQWHIGWTPPDRAAHRRGVEACLEAIRAGEVYQACVCGRFGGRYRGEPLGFFVDAVRSSSPARAAFVAGEWGAVASLSPELFLARRGEQVRSSPIKGTLPLSADPARLRASVKDVAENVMIVDLVRNDLGRLALPGSVTVRELLSVHPAPGVWHLVSTVAAAVPEQVGNAGLLAATFPPASVTGTPKHRARQLLSEWEPEHRGVYCGAVGMASPLAGLELNVAIRTVEFAPDHPGADTGTVGLGVGGGITIDSDPAAEWQECLDKAASILGVSCSAVPLSPAEPPAPPRTVPAWTPRPRRQRSRTRP
ncbi:aminodeoxychorismate synthase component I [Rhodococcus sp. D2-41]|uniref:aminodeoxychorismate synthase component I n=1 Tax=Speluncibacter jeojiensis TaxID=2710754 RepID=UPI00240F7172|nr:aminodeoxychorismate synthase component I [Rhodococcus sp. D2-41]MDG3012244.1 aminodeoxychorismate synthase component I [Rhodococcus sp. D2-41]